MTKSNLQYDWNEEDIKQIEANELRIEWVEAQLQRYQKGYPKANILAACTLGNGIKSIPENQWPAYLKIWENASNQGKLSKFVPASGAATRMFQSLITISKFSNSVTLSQLKILAKDNSEALDCLKFVENISKFPFYQELCDFYNKNLEELIPEMDLRQLLTYILEDEGLGFKNRPKALIPFHGKGTNVKTALEEHLFEALHLITSQENSCLVHFTISPEHESMFLGMIEYALSNNDLRSTQYKITTSFQSNHSLAIAVDGSNKPVRDDNQKLIFRPSGHGALLKNLQETDGEFIFIKNIDNVCPQHSLTESVLYRRIMAGYCVLLQEKIFGYLEKLHKPDCELDTNFIETISEFIINELGQRINVNISISSNHEIRELLIQTLNRPLRVCAMVANTGEPGGGPFWLKNSKGFVSLQIVEKAQVDLDNEQQRNIFNSAKYFNPTDMICAIKDFRGKTFNLNEFKDPEAGFIVTKSQNGKKVRSLERPGLWNGSMALWNTVFIEVPLFLFTPVKTINDLLKNEHQA